MAAGSGFRPDGAAWNKTGDFVPWEFRAAVRVGAKAELTLNSHSPPSAPPDGVPALFPPNCERLVSVAAAL